MSQQLKAVKTSSRPPNLGFKAKKSSKPTKTRLTIVCNPFNPDLKEAFEAFDKESMNKVHYETLIKDLDSGFRSYEILGNSDRIEVLRQASDAIGLRRVVLPVIMDSEKEMDTITIDTLSTLTTRFVGKHLGIKKPLGVNYTVFVPPLRQSERDKLEALENPRARDKITSRRVIVFTPYYIDTGGVLYDTQARINDLAFTSNLNDWKGFVAMPYNPYLTRHAVTLCDQKGITVDVGDITEYDGMTLIKLGTRTKMKQLRDCVLLQLDAMKSQGHFAIRIDDLPPTEVDLMEELVSMWGGNTTARYDDTIVFQLKKDDFPHYASHDFGEDPASWVIKNIRRLNIGDLPVSRVRGPWCLWPESLIATKGMKDSDEARFDRLAQIQARISYIAVRAYDQVASAGSYHLFMDRILHVRDDLSISVTLASLRDYEAFYQAMLKLLDYRNQLSAIRLEKDDDVATVIWALQQTDRKDRLSPLGFRRDFEVNCRPKSMRYFAVIDRKDSDKVQSLVDNRRTMEEARSRLRKLFMNDLKACKGGSDIVSGDEIKDMNIAELSDIIKVRQPGNKGIVYCYSSSTIRSLVHKIDPVSRQYLSFDLLKRAVRDRFYDDNVIGLVDAGPIKGFAHEDHSGELGVYTKKYLISPDGGSILMRRVFSSEINAEVILAEEILGGQFEIDLHYPSPEGRSIDLMTLSLKVEKRDINSNLPSVPEYDEIVLLLNNLWSRGALMNVWARAYTRHMGKISSKPFLVDPVLENAGESLQDGDLALKMLKKLDEETS